MWETLIISPFTNILLWIYKLVFSNFGIAIILFTILIRLITHPLMVSQIKSSHKMQELQQSKKWQEIQKKYKGNREQLAQEQMKIYKELGINPLGSCLPTIIQIPIIFGLYQSIVRAMAASPIQLLTLTRSLYPLFDAQSLIPLNSHFLWMNLGQPERVYITGIGIPVLAIFVAITTYIQSRVTLPSAATPGDQAGAMNSMMSIYMPLLLFYLTLTFASGLSIYFIASNLFSIAQYAFMGKVNWSNLLPKPKSAVKSK